MLTVKNPVFIHPGFVSGKIYWLHRGHSSSAAASPAAVDIIYFFPFVLAHTIVFTKGVMRVQTGGAASAVKAGIWIDSPISHRPLGAPLYKDDTGVATTASTTNVDIALGAGILGPGVYWWGTKGQATLPVMWSVIGGDQNLGWLVGGTAGAAPNVNGLSSAQAYATALPTFAEGASFTEGGVNPPIAALST